MGYELPERTEWGVRALQGVTFWVGHRKAMYDGYHLLEAAIVTELCALIHSALRGPDLILECEVMYQKLIPPGVKSEVFGEKARVDLAVTDVKLKGLDAVEVPDHVRYIIEVKRWEVDNKEIINDLKRLHEALTLSPHKFRGLLFVVAQSAIPDLFATENGDSIRGAKQIEGTTGWYVIRQTCKAASSFRKKHDAHYACMIEVFTYEPKRKDELAEEEEIQGVAPGG